MKMTDAWVLERYVSWGDPAHQMFGSYEEAMTAWEMTEKQGRVLQFSSWFAEQQTNLKRDTVIEFLKKQREWTKSEYQIYETIY